MKRIRYALINSLYSEISKNRELYLPVKEPNALNFKKYI